MALPIRRRDLLKGAGAVLMANAACGTIAAAATPLELADPESMGFASDLPGRFAALETAGRLLNVHGVVALRKGRIVFERYMAGSDEIWGRPIGTIEFKAGALHDMRSVTKSIVGMLYGI